MNKVTKDTIINDVVRMNPGNAQFLFEIGMHCLGCPSAAGETLEEACMVHGANVDELIEKINSFMEKSAE